MNANIARKALIASAGALVVGGAASAADIFVSENISTSVTWTADNVYRLQNQIYVLPGASLTIEPGTIVASIPTTDGSGSLAVCRGAKIYVLGTAANPVIMTSSNDDFVTWREAANEWGNLTIMGRGYISDSFEPGNTASFSANNVAAMEGLVASFPGDSRVLYGGGDDDDDSGCISYLSIRYGGRVVGLGNELNGLSLGGIGRETDIKFVEIMNNVDDGIEIWGGTVNIQFASIWNIGDDSFDVDQGWRGKGQFILLVQGYSLDASQGSGVGDNCFEVDGAENSDAQPVTTATIYNATVIGQPAPGAGDQGMAFRDNANVQYRNSIFMDLGDAVVKNDNVDGDGSQGYGFNGTLTWAQRWTTPYNTYSTVNAPANPAQYYTAQTSGRLIEVTGSVFFRNLDPNAYNEANARGVFDASNNNVLIPGFDPANQPIKSITRGPAVTKGGKTMLPVIGLDPRAQGPATSGAVAAPDDGFFFPVTFRGAFSANTNWLCGWTAAYNYGFVTTPAASCGLPNVAGCDAPNPNPPGDLNGDGLVNGADLSILLGDWGTCPPKGTCLGDINGDGVVNGADLSILLSNWS
ncbi:MAG: dockerin type I domain-containing protein [Phycisphaerales bacterium]